MQRSINGRSPVIHETAWIAPTAAVLGDVHLGPKASIWYGAVLRGDRDRIEIGEASNLQDGVVVHCDPGKPVTVGSFVSVGHKAMLHGCTIGDGALIGISATVLNGAVVGEQSLVAAGSVVLEGTVVPPRSLVAGVPAKVRRQLSDDEVERLRSNAENYLGITELHRD
ncbi:gamma carbonic anhydrase family protein [Ruicaihuangia caeni]|uniref:gamma carbonic anhydrase family protein n=1 Tax=Ruicaihuangia caeni TaxID=3042517 RepID=UPI0033904361